MTPGGSMADVWGPSFEPPTDGVRENSISQPSVAGQVPVTRSAGRQLQVVPLPPSPAPDPCRDTGLADTGITGSKGLLAAAGAKGTGRRSSGVPLTGVPTLPSPLTGASAVTGAGDDQMPVDTVTPEPILPRLRSEVVDKWGDDVMGENGVQCVVFAGVPTPNNNQQKVKRGMLYWETPPPLRLPRQKCPPPGRHSPESSGPPPRRRTPTSTWRPPSPPIP